MSEEAEKAQIRKEENNRHRGGNVGGREEGKGGRSDRRRAQERHTNVNE